jgi:chemotaxis protein CheD
MTAPQNVYVAQGDYAVGSRPDMVISAFLGSCVAVCLWDAASRTGGMNHILLPDPAGGRMRAVGFGASDMERLLNALLKGGATRVGLEAKMFGGAAVVAGLSDIGAQNADFVRGFLSAEGIPLVSEDTGGTRARQVRFWPASGRAQFRIAGLAEAAAAQRAPPRRGNDVELFG